MKARLHLMAALILAAGSALAAQPDHRDGPRGPDRAQQRHRGQEGRPAANRPPEPRGFGRAGEPRRDLSHRNPHGSRGGPGYPAPRMLAEPRPPIMHSPGLGPRMVVIPRPPRPHGWYGPAMRDFRFCQSPRGATMTLQSRVLFDTDKSDLRPGALDRLEPLAAWLADNPGVRVAIDGHTDSRASDAYNQALSERRAESVYAALAGMGAANAEFSVTGHGEARPVATNATAAGMQLNRRVEVTLLDQQAESFGGPLRRCP
jgi:outer membrane protein OmpA-like peptidoglycan-associated protein